MPEKELLLSVVITGRDDGYMPDFRYRLQVTLDHFARNIKLLGRVDEVEIIFVDWGSAPPLSETLPIGSGTKSVVRWLHVSSETIQEALGSETNFHNTIAFNAGLRRARGRFVAFFPADAIIPIHGLAQLIELLAGRIHCPVDVQNTLWFIARGHVPWRFVASQPTIDEWDRYLWMNAWTIPIDEGTVPSLFGGAASFVLSRSSWLACRGLDETLGGWGGSDTDIGFRIGTRHPWLDLTFLGIRAYHMEHGPGGTRGEAVKAANPLIFDRPFQANNTNWGLASATLHLTQSRDQRLELELQGGLSHCSGSASQAAGLSHAWPQIQRTEVDLAAADAIRQTIQQLGESLNRLPRRAAELEKLLAIACWCTDRPVHSCIDFGVRSPVALGVIARLAPAVTIHGVAASPPSVVCQVSVFLHLILRHTGYLRFVFGDPNTAVRRALASSPGGTTCDFAMIPCDLAVDVYENVLKQVFDTLNPDGACLVSADSSEAFRGCWELAKRLLPASRFFLVGESCCCGFILKKGHQSESTACTNDTTIHFKPHTIHKLGRTMHQLHRWRKLRAWTNKLAAHLRSWVKA